MGASGRNGKLFAGRRAWDKLYATELAADLLFALGCAATRGFTRPLVAASGSILGGAAAAAATTASLSGTLLDSLPLETLGEALTDSTVPNTLTTATDALFGTGTTHDLFSSASSVLATSFSGIAEGAGDGVVDLVSDGIGSLITSIFD
jgi:hypothetical protein